MKVKVNKPKGQRIFKSVKIHSTYDDGSKKLYHRPFWIEPLEKQDDEFLWFCLQRGDWFTDRIGASCSAYYAMSCEGFKDAYSLKAVIRLVKKWNVPKGTVFRASLPYSGHDFYITK